jgi:hypothetical protein
MKRLLSTDPEGFDGPCGELLHRLYSRRQEIKARLHQIEGNLLDGNLEGTSEHNRWAGNRCAPLIDDYVVVFTVEEYSEENELTRHVYLLAVELEKHRH